MNGKDFSFSPIEHGYNWISIGFGMIALFGLLVLLYQLNSKRKKGYSEISSFPIIILVALATVLASSAFFYSIRSSDRLEMIYLSTDEIRTPFGTVKTADIKSVYFFPDQTYPNTNPADSISETYLIIEEVNGHRHPISSKTYDIEAINNAWNSLHMR